MNKVNIILASGSPRRKELLALDLIPFEVLVPEIDETPRQRELPKAMVKRLSLEKAKVVLRSLENKVGIFWIISADTTVVNSKNKNLGKPEHRKEAIQMITSLQGAVHSVHTAFTLLKAKDGKVIDSKTKVVTTRVIIRKLSSAEVRAYVDRGESFDKAGAYAAQGIGMNLIEKISGSYTNVIGLPMAEVIQELKKSGWKK